MGKESRRILDLPTSSEFIYSLEGCKRYCIPVAVDEITQDRYVELNGSKCLVKSTNVPVSGPIPILKSGRD